MNKLTYYVSAVYQRLNEKDPEISFLNIRMIILMNIIFHLAQVIVWMKNGLHKNLFADANPELWTFFFIIGCLIFYIIGILFPRDKLEAFEVKHGDKKFYFRIAVLYFILNFSALMGLLFYYLPVSN
jgi:hypothetical protein